MNVAQLCKLRDQKAHLPACPRKRTQLAKLRHIAALTIIELVVVMVIILILAGLVLGVSSYVQNKGARARAETEIAALSAAMESYKADNGIYPRGNANLNPATTPYDTDTLDAKLNTDPTSAGYRNASFYVYAALSGLNASQQPISGMKSYFAFKPQMLAYTDSTKTTVAYIRDPWGNSYGYSTANQVNSANGYNPTFDLWSTTGPTPTPAPSPIQIRWVKNW